MQESSHGARGWGKDQGHCATKLRKRPKPLGRSLPEVHPVRTVSLGHTRSSGKVLGIKTLHTTARLSARTALGRLNGLDLTVQ